MNKMKTDLTLSIVIPIYKVEAYLQECVDSVLNQTYKNLEIILVDDGSPDRCPAICDEYAKKDNRIHVIHKANGGLSDARNVGLKAATGDYVIFLDSDDYYGMPDFLDVVVKATADGTKDAVFFRRTNFYDNGERPETVNAPYNLEWNMLDVNKMLYELAKHDQLDANACLKVTKKEILQKNEIYFRKGMLSEDVEWYGRYLPFINSIALINKPDYHYRKKRAGSITATVTERNVRDLFYTIQTQSQCLRDSKMDSNKVNALLLYHSYQYYIILGLTNNVVNGESYHQLLEEYKAYRWLSSYSKSPKTKKCSFILKLLGVKFASKIFGYYIKIK